MKSFRHSPPFPKVFPRPFDVAKDLRSSRWTRFRATHLQAHPMCNDCGAVASEVHHVVPRSVDPSRTYDWANLMSLCRLCHQRRHGGNLQRHSP